MFERELRDLEFVPRWGIATMHHPGVVATHLFYNAYYTKQIAGFIGWEGDLGHLLSCALEHDLDEQFMSDMPGPSKRAIIDEDKSKKYINTELKRRFGELSVPSSEEKSIIKVADYVDEIFKICMEMAMGNKTISHIYDNSFFNMCKWIGYLPCSEDTKHRLLQLIQERIKQTLHGHSIIPTG